MIDAAAGSATSYSASLADATEKLAGANDREALRTVIERLVEGAKEMEVNNKKLEARLSASRQEIEQLQQNLETVRTESLTDPLTTLCQPQILRSALANAIAEAKEKNEPLSLMMADVDHFKTLQRPVRPSHRRSGAAAGRHVGEAERQGPATSPRAMAARNSSSRCPTRRCNRRSRSPTTSAARS